MDRIHELEAETAELRAANRSVRSRMVELEEIIDGNEHTITKLNARVNQLSLDLAGLTSAQDILVATSLKKAEEDLRLMIESQKALWKDVTGKREAMRALLSDRGINLPRTPQQSSLPLRGESYDEGVISSSGHTSPTRASRSGHNSGALDTSKAAAAAAAALKIS